MARWGLTQPSGVEVGYGVGVERLRTYGRVSPAKTIIGGENISRWQKTS
jgi:hypothetical protein